MALDVPLGDPSSSICIRCDEVEAVAWNIYHLRQCQHAYCVDCFRKDIKKWIRTMKDEIYALSSANKKQRTKYRRRTKKSSKKMRKKRIQRMKLKKKHLKYKFLFVQLVKLRYY